MKVWLEGLGRREGGGGGEAGANRRGERVDVVDDVGGDGVCVIGDDGEEVVNYVFVVYDVDVIVFGFVLEVVDGERERAVGVFASDDGDVGGIEGVIDVLFVVDVVEGGKGDGVVVVDLLDVVCESGIL